VQKRQPTENQKCKNDYLLKTKRKLKLKHKLSGNPIFAFSLPVGAIHPLPPGSFHVKSPNGLNPTLSEFNEIWHTCWFQTPSLKSTIFQWSDDQFPRYGEL